MSEAVQVATEIKNQIGGRALFMLGAKDLAAGRADDLPFLHFRIRGSRKANAIRVTLERSDTYRVTFYRWHGTSCKLVSQADDVYGDSLRTVIEFHTGLATSL